MEAKFRSPSNNNSGQRRSSTSPATPSAPKPNPNKKKPKKKSGISSITPAELYATDKNALKGESMKKSPANAKSPTKKGKPKPFGSANKPQNFPRILNSDQLILSLDGRLTDPRFLKEHLDKFATENSGKCVKLMLRCAENQITDRVVKYLVDFLLQYRETIQLTSVFLHKNKITDKGADHLARLIQECGYFIHEIHLSHNLITNRGAEKIFLAANSSALYPKLMEELNPPQHLALWLRLEWNCIVHEEFLAFIRDNKIAFCDAELAATEWRDRSCVSYRQCSRSKDTKIHVFLMDLQSPLQEDLPLLKELEADQGMSSSSPLLIFLDTNAILGMLEFYKCDMCKGGSTGKEQYSIVRNFTFSKLLEMHQRNMFGNCFSNHGDRVYLYLCNTVQIEMDYRKKMMSRASHCIKNFLSGTEKSFLGRIVRCVTISFLAWHLSGIRCGAQSARSGSASPQPDLGLHFPFGGEIHSKWSQTHQRGGLASLQSTPLCSLSDTVFQFKNAMILSNDKSLTVLAKKHNVPTASLKDLDKQMKKLVESNKPWTSSALLECIPEAHQSLDGKPLGEPIKPHSILDAIEASIDITALLQQRLLAAVKVLQSIGDELKSMPSDPSKLESLQKNIQVAQSELLDAELQTKVQSAMLEWQQEIKNAGQAQWEDEEGMEDLEVEPVTKDELNVTPQEFSEFVQQIRELKLSQDTTPSSSPSKLEVDTEEDISEQEESDHEEDEEEDQ